MTSKLPTSSALERTGATWSEGPAARLERAGIRAARFLRDRLEASAGPLDAEAASVLAELRAALEGMGATQARREAIRCELDQRALPGLEGPPAGHARRLEAAKREAADRNAREFGTDPSWYGVKP